MQLLNFWFNVCFICFAVNAGTGISAKIDPDCDDGEKDLDVDWDGSDDPYTCFLREAGERQLLEENPEIKPKLECDKIPAGDLPQRYCMNTTITYLNPLPTHGGHRPVWPVYGEYRHIPPQRWSHSVDHGAIVMLTHPCAEKNAVQKLKDIVRGCIWKHIIGISNDVPSETPFVLIAWGCRLKMASIDKKEVENFINNYAFYGPEGDSNEDGIYKLGLIKRASPPGGSISTVMCPVK